MKIHISTLPIFLVIALFSLMPMLTEAYCDSMDGPVVQNAQTALDTGDITPVLKWITEEQEREVETTFNEVLEIRDRDQNVQKVADRHLFETVVRLHCEAERAPHKGLKPVGTDFIMQVGCINKRSVFEGTLEVAIGAMQNIKTESLIES